MGTLWNRDFFQLMTHVAAQHMRNKSRIGKGKIQRQENKREEGGGREGGRERVRGQSLEVMGIGRNSVGNPCRQTH